MLGHCIGRWDVDTRVVKTVVFSRIRMALPS